MRAFLGKLATKLQIQNKNISSSLTADQISLVVDDSAKDEQPEAGGGAEEGGEETLDLEI